MNLYEALETSYLEHLDKEVLRYAKIYSLDMGEDNKTSHNNEGDAFKHCFMQAELTLWFGSLIGEMIGIHHENTNLVNPEKERKMDLWNNKIGREIGRKIKSPLWFLHKRATYNKIAIDIMLRMASGDLITSLEDARL